MRAVFGVVSLLVVLALVALLAARQLKTTVSVVALPGAGAASLPGPSTVRDPVQQAGQQVGADVDKALEQGAAARKEEADK